MAIDGDLAVRDWAEFASLLGLSGGTGELGGGPHAFRGCSTAEGALLTSIGRFTPYDEGRERYILDSFRRQATNRVFPMPDSELGWMALARHHGLPTRLMDWSMSPLVAAWFAASGPDGFGGASERDFAIWILRYDDADFVPANALPGLDPFALDRDFVLASPAHYADRVTAQRGFFSVHRHPARPFRSARLRRMVLPGAERQDFMRRLDFLGINHASIDPGLDGLGRQLAWFYAQGRDARE